MLAAQVMAVAVVVGHDNARIANLHLGPIILLAIVSRSNRSLHPFDEKMESKSDIQPGEGTVVVFVVW